MHINFRSTWNTCYHWVFSWQTSLLIDRQQISITFTPLVLVMILLFNHIWHQFLLLLVGFLFTIASQLSLERLLEHHSGMLVVQPYLFDLNPNMMILVAREVQLFLVHPRINHQKLGKTRSGMSMVVFSVRRPFEDFCFSSYLLSHILLSFS